MNNSVAWTLLEINAVGFSLKKPTTFKSGIVSPVYVDNRILPFHPNQWHVVIDGFKTLLEQQALRFDVIAGVAVGGVPHSAALAYDLRVPSVFVRQESKEHGKGKRVEGGDVYQKRALLIEDMVTTGGSSLDAVWALRAEGAVIEDVCAIISYGFAEAVEAFKAANVRLHTLTTFDAILLSADIMGKLNAEEAAIVRSWMQNPRGWKPK
jgi:orotate phosphoribosyltransferase